MSDSGVKCKERPDPGVHAKNQSLRAEIRDQSLIMGRGEGGGTTKWDNHGPETYCAPP